MLGKKTMSEEKAFLGRHPDVRLGMANELRGFSKEALACFESEANQNHPYKILSQREWERRNTKELVFWQRMSAWIGVARAIVGALITILGAKLLGS